MDDTALDVFRKATVGAREVIERQIDAICQGTAPRTAQDESQATYFGGRRPEDGRIDWTNSADAVFDLVRAVTHPYPGAFTEVNGMRLVIWWPKPLPEGSGTPGLVLSIAPLRVAAGAGMVEIIKYQWEGSPEQYASSGIHGLRKGQLLGREQGSVSASVHEPTSGVVTAIGEFTAPHVSGLPLPTVTLDSDGTDQWLEREPPPNPFALEPDEVAARIGAAGIVGIIYCSPYSIFFIK